MECLDTGEEVIAHATDSSGVNLISNLPAPPFLPSVVWPCRSTHLPLDSVRYLQ